MGGTSATGPRARYREHTRSEIKQVALRQLGEGGAQAVALTRIAKELAMSGPAMYRYFGSREELLTSLIRDAYDDVAEAVRQAAGDAPAAPAQGRAALLTLARSYLDWAWAEPHRYLLIQGPPAPGYAAPPDTVRRARGVLGPFLRLFSDGATAGAEPTPAVRPVIAEMDAWLARDAAVREWVSRCTGPEAQPASAGRALAGGVLVWSQLHGVAGLETSGQYAGMGHRAETLLTAHLELLADGFGLE